MYPDDSDMNLQDHRILWLRLGQLPSSAHSPCPQQPEEAAAPACFRQGELVPSPRVLLPLPVLGARGESWRGAPWPREGPCGRCPAGGCSCWPTPSSREGEAATGKKAQAGRARQRALSARHSDYN